ncbi:hypothetical protein SAY86_025967 [Trapa natans]|uniref:Pentatricopeptide repeat-containing protein n=1 Tax=Trapa natans TaxID=22666 RepID=A0AAN7KEZ3_TRANT|nr:hypothetical protein SAY86_025967 [Trapa natans]
MRITPFAASLYSCCYKHNSSVERVPQLARFRTWASGTGCDNTTLNAIVSKVRFGRSEDEGCENLINDLACGSLELSHSLVEKLLQKFWDDWKTAVGIFRWAESRSGFDHVPEAYDMIVDILGKSRQIDRMRGMLDEMRRRSLVRISTVARVMRRLAGVGLWEDAVKVFDELESLGLKRNTETMNLLLDSLCKEGKVERAREIFMALKPHISPNPHTFNIFIHGWCKLDMVDEAHWTIQEMKGYGVRPCVISYSTIIHCYCRMHDFTNAYKLLDEMHSQGCPPNVITYSIIMNYLAKTERFDEALQVPKMMKSIGCEPDTQFYNSLIHVMGRAGLVDDAVYIFKVTMPGNGVLPNTSTYNSMISMFCHHGREQEALGLLDEMDSHGTCKQDAQTYHPLFKYCFKRGKTDDLLRELLDHMVNKNHISLDVSTYTLLIHGLCRANKCEAAYLLLEEMVGREMAPRLSTCRLLLEEVKQRNMHDAANMIEGLMRKLKLSSNKQGYT